MKCPDAQSSSSHLWRSGGCCWIIKVFKRLTQGSMAYLCARTGDLLLEALSWLLSVPNGRDHWPSSICFLWAGCSSLPRVTPKATKYTVGCYLGFWSVLPEGVGWRAKLLAWDRGTARAGELARAWPEGTVLSTGPRSAHPRFSVWTCLRGGAQCLSMLQLCWREAQHPHDGPWSETHHFHQCKENQIMAILWYLGEGQESPWKLIFHFEKSI